MAPGTALIIVDAQYDFFPGGALAVPDGDAIVHPLTLAARDCDLVIASRDWHPDNHHSFADNHPSGLWPPHCVQGTKGARIHPRLRKLANFTISKGDERTEDAYSAFAGHTLRPTRTLEEILRKQGITRVIVGGLALDYCVRLTALDANACGLTTIVPLDCTRALDEAGHERTLAQFALAGVQVVDHWQR